MRDAMAAVPYNNIVAHRGRISFSIFQTCVCVRFVFGCCSLDFEINNNFLFNLDMYIFLYGRVRRRTLHSARNSGLRSN